MLNTKERPTLEQALEEELRPLRLDEALALTAEGAQLLDARDPADFAGAHLVGSVNVGLGGSYATWAGTILDHERPIVLERFPLLLEAWRSGRAQSSSDPHHDPRFDQSWQTMLPPRSPVRLVTMWSGAYGVRTYFPV